MRLDREKSILHRLKDLPVSRNLPNDALLALIQHGEKQFHAKRTWVLKDHEVSDLYFVLQGTVALCSQMNATTVALDEVVEQGMHFGSFVHSAGLQSARAISDSVILKLRREHFEGLVNDQRDGLLSQRMFILKNIEKCKVFQGMKPVDKMHFARHVTTMATDKGQLVIRQGGKSEHMYGILEGVFQVEKNGELIAELSNQDSFGEMGVFLQGPRTANVRSKEQGLLLQVPNSLLHQIRNRNFHTDFELEYMVSHRLATGEGKK